MKASLPNNEVARIESLKSFKILDTDPEDAYDDLTRLASFICGTPIATLTFVDTSRQWFKSKIDLAPSETPRDVAFCAYTILENKTLIVQDALEDDRFRDNPLVLEDPAIRFYAGSPLRDSDGNNIGTICAMDRKPRQLSDEQIRALESLARQVMVLLEVRKLNDRMSHYKYYVERANDIIFECGKEGRFTYVNPISRKLLGYEIEDLIGRHFSEIIRVDFKQKVISFYENQFRNRIADSYYEFPAVSRNGNTVWMGQFVHMEIVGERIERIQGATRDITQIRELEEQLSGSEKRYRSLVESMGEGIVQTNLEDVIQFANRQFCDMVGYSLEELEGRVGHNFLVDPADAEQVRVHNQDRKRGKGGSYDIALIRKNGDKVWVHVNATPLVDEKNQVVGTIGVISDVSDLKLAEAALREAEQKYRNIFEGAINGVFQSTIDGRFLNMNPAMAKIYGYASPDEMIGSIQDMSRQVFVDPDDREQLKELLETDGQVAGYESRVYRKDGKIIWISETIRAVKDEQGQVSYYEGITQDITEHKELQQERETLIAELRQALSKVKKLSGMLPICASCKKIRDDKGYWKQIEVYLKEHTEADFSHGLCKDCAHKLYPELFVDDV